MEANDRGKASSSTPAPPSTKKSATVKNLPSTARGTKTGPTEPTPMRPLPTLGPESCIAFFVNGECQGIAFRDLYDFLPLRTPPNKAHEKKRGHKDGLREHKENPSLTYPDSKLQFSSHCNTIYMMVYLRHLWSSPKMLFGGKWSRQPRRRCRYALCSGNSSLGCKTNISSYTQHTIILSRIFGIN